MPECKCPTCKTLFPAPSSAFGRMHRCSSCGTEYKLDIEHLARYELPTAIHIYFRSSRGQSFTKFPLPVIVEYGYSLPPLRSDERGELLITREMFLRAERDEATTGIMDHHGDYSLNRFVRIRAPGRREALEMSKERARSPWPILDFEKELYGDMPSLAAAYVPSEDLAPIVAIMDLAEGRDVVYLELVVDLLQ